MHKPVMAQEAVEFLKPASGAVYVDATLGGGGHTEDLLEGSAPKGRVIAIDRDLEALERSAPLKAKYGDRLELVHSNFSELKNILAERGVEKVDGIIADFGLSSDQLESAERGFSFLREARLDMRMDRDLKTSAYEIVNQASVQELKKIFREYGEERRGGLIARVIERERKEAPIETTTQLADLIAQTVGFGGQGGYRKGRLKKHPATLIFQALRIAVNDELGSIEKFLDASVASLRPGGRIAIISFHSLEDRIVKNFFRTHEKGCICPPRIPKCVCGKVSELKLLTRKAVKPTEAEVDSNPRARSARLRAAERINNTFIF